VFEKEIAAGMELLDCKAPGWREKIDVFKLDLNDGQMCVLGQVYGSYDDGLNELGLSDCGAEYGFYVQRFLDVQRPDRNEDAGSLYRQLTFEWLDELKPKQLPKPVVRTKVPA
jgi:hypothetical protein